MTKPSILSLPNYRRLYFSGLSSELGSFVTDSAVMLFLFNITDNDKSFMGINRAAFLFFLTIGSLLGGVIGEKYNRRKILLICEAIRIPIICMLFFVSTPWVIVFINGLIAFFTGIFKPSRQALVNDIVPSDQIKSANSLFGSTYAIIHMLGPLIGATLYVSLKGITEIVFFDICTYLLGMFLLYKMVYGPPAKLGKSSQTFVENLSEGTQYIKKNPKVACVILTNFTMGASIGMLIPLLLPFIKEILGKSDFHYGIFMACFGIGGVLGAALAGRLSKSISSGKMILFSVVCEAIFFAFWIRVTNFELNCLVMFFWGILVFVRVTAQLNYLSETVETQFLTRVYSILDLSFIVPNVAAGILIGVIGNEMSTFEILNWTSIVFIIVVIVIMFFPSTHSLWRDEVKQVYRDPNSFDHD